MSKETLGTIVLVMWVLLLISVVSWSQTIVINEVAWAGTAASHYDEWIELYNPLEEAVDLTGWTLTFGTVMIDLGTGVNTLLEPGGYFLLERTNDETVSDIDADLIYTGGLVNDGMLIELLDPTGEVVDTANAGQESGWAAGSDKDGDLPCATMERVDPLAADTPDNWRSNEGTLTCGHDAKGNTLNGTPKAKNAATIVFETVPVVAILSPVADGEVISGVFIITWTAMDPDGSSDQLLQIDILLSSDGGEGWELIVEGLVGGSYVWDTAAYANGDAYQLKVVATDTGGNNGEGISPLFSIANPG
jgi:hypothetical protein